MSLGYIGSKKSLKDFLLNNLKNHIDITRKDITIADLFAGTGFVGNFFNKEHNFKVIANDLEYYSYVLIYAKLNSSYSDKLNNIINNINEKKYNIKYDNLIRNTYTPTDTCERMYFTTENGDLIDYSMNVINHLKEINDIDYNEEMFLKASLLTSLDKVANTSSVYGAYLKKFKSSALKQLVVIPVHLIQNNKSDNIIYNDDILNLNVTATIGYLDPPYNSRQYGSNYSQLNYILKYDKKIEIKGKTGIIKDWNRSSFCSKRTIVDSITQILNNNNFEILMYSYNNEGLLSKEDLIDIFKIKYSNVVLYEKEYKKFKAQDSVQKKNVIEYLFICDNKYTNNNTDNDKVEKISDEDIFIDYDKMKVIELRNECKNRGLKKYSKLKKIELIQLLKN
jgi:adenine-specific DNA-methyltransferase